MKKRLSLRGRLTMMASAFLLLSCTALTLLSNYSATKMMDAIPIMPSSQVKLVQLFPLYHWSPA